VDVAVLTVDVAHVHLALVLHFFQKVVVVGQLEVLAKA
jgi:hypothetical protein